MKNTVVTGPNVITWLTKNFPGNVLIAFGGWAQVDHPDLDWNKKVILTYDNDTIDPRWTWENGYLASINVQKGDTLIFDNLAQYFAVPA